MAKVILVCGRICCGKTTYAHTLRRERKAVVLSCDEVMLALLDEYLGDQHEKYAARTQQYLLSKALEIVETGINVVLDWGPWTKAGRDNLKRFFLEHGVECELHAIRISESEWRERIQHRNCLLDRDAVKAYHVDEGLMQKFLSKYEEPSTEEIDMWVERVKTFDFPVDPAVT